LGYRLGWRHSKTQNPKDEFLVEQTAYFRVLFSAPQATLSAGRVRDVVVTRSCGSPAVETSTVLVANGAATASGSAADVSWSSGVTQASFSFRVSRAIACVEPDSRNSLIVSVVGEVDYASLQGGPTSELMRISGQMPVTTLQTASQTRRASSRPISVSGGRSIGDKEGQSSVSSVFGPLGGAAGVAVAAAVALIVALVAAIAVALRKRRAHRQVEGKGLAAEKSAIELGRSSSSLSARRRNR
jgi:hypothetical protein